MPPERDHLDSLLPVILFAGIAAAGILCVSTAYWVLLVD